MRERTYKRETLARSYELIEKDLIKSIQLLKLRIIRKRFFGYPKVLLIC